MASSPIDELSSEPMNEALDKTMRADKPTKTPKQARRQKEWIKKCVSNFSLYANVIGNTYDDPFEVADAIEAGEFKVKISKSAKKRLRRLKKKKRCADIGLVRSAPAQIRKLNLALAKKQTKRDIKRIASKLSKLPL